MNSREISVREVRSSDAAGWLEMRCALWPEGPEAEHREEIERFFAHGSIPSLEAALVAVDSTGALVGFVELALRAYAEGCATAPVAYLEGWFVVPGARGQGVGGRLVEAAEAWGREQGCTEFASDADVDNEVSAEAHKALGFEDMGLIRCFKKTI